MTLAFGSLLPLPFWNSHPKRKRLKLLKRLKLYLLHPPSGLTPTTPAGRSLALVTAPRIYAQFFKAWRNSLSQWHWHTCRHHGRAMMIARGRSPEVCQHIIGQSVPIWRSHWRRRSNQNHFSLTAISMWAMFPARQTCRSNFLLESAAKSKA